MANTDAQVSHTLLMDITISLPPYNTTAQQPQNTMEYLLAPPPLDTKNYLPLRRVSAGCSTLRIHIQPNTIPFPHHRVGHDFIDHCWRLVVRRCQYDLAIRPYGYLQLLRILRIRFLRSSAQREITLG